MAFFLRVILLLFLPVLSFGQRKENAVDSIRTQEDLKAFLNRYYAKEEYISSIAWTVDRYKSDEDAEVSIVREQCARFGGKPWFVTDLNSDTRSDLLLITRDLNIDCFICEPDGGFILRGLAWKDMFEYTLPLPVKAGGKDAVVLQKYYHIFLYSSKGFKVQKAMPWKQDTVIFRYGHFLTYNSNPVKEKIEKISLHSDVGGCMGVGYFLMKLDSSGKVSFLGDPFIYEGMEDTVVSHISRDEVLSLHNIVNYAGTNLKEVYQTPIMDECTYLLTIRYADGREKGIKDYGQRGNYSLMAIYGIMENWIKELKWKKVE